jgi:hypothetical protein
MASYLTQQDLNDYGTDLIDLTQRAAATALSPQLERIEQENARLQHWLGVEARHRLDREVEQAIPDYREVDASPRRHAWLRSVDPLSGRVRQQLLNDAIANGAANRVISFFNQFKREAGAVSHASSSQTGSSGSRRVYTRSQIAEIYAAHRKGRYAGREQEWQRQEADIFAAVREGRVRDFDYITK